MKEFAICLLLCVAGCNSAGIGIGGIGGGAKAVGGAAAGGLAPEAANFATGFAAKGVFAGPFFAATIKKFAAFGFVAPCGPCNVEDAENTGMCQPAGTCGGQVVGDCDEYGAASSKLECCKEVIQCGQTIRNGSYISYFQNPSFPESDKGTLPCNIKVEIMKNVCQLRLDFLEFELPAPEADGKCSSKNSMVIMAPQMPLGVLGRTKNNGGLCGLNTGQHMYIPVVQGEQVQLVTTLEGYGRVPINRANLAYDTSNAYKWNIMITQIDCGPETTSYRYDALVDATPGCFTGLKAPEGCLQYFTEPYDKISSFNFDGFSKIAPNQDYAICIRPNTDYFQGLTIRSNVFKMPVGGHDSKVCGSGVEIVNKQTSKDCCLDPSSSYLGYTAYQPYSKAKYEQKAYRRYWCGEHLGPEEQISGGGSIIKVFTGENYKCTYDPVGFEIEYKVDIGH